MTDNSFGCKLLSALSEAYKDSEEQQKKGLLWNEYIQLYVAKKLFDLYDDVYKSSKPYKISECKSINETLKNFIKQESAADKEPLDLIDRFITQRLQLIQPAIESMVKKSNAAAGASGGEDDRSFACQSLLSFGPGSKECKHWFDNIIGLEDAKELIQDGMINALLYPNMFGTQASACLFYGPPGTGKTLMAMAMMNELSHQTRPNDSMSPCAKFLFLHHPQICSRASMWEKLRKRL